MAKKKQKRARSRRRSKSNNLLPLVAIGAAVWLFTRPKVVVIKTPVPGTSMPELPMPSSTGSAAALRGGIRRFKMPYYS